MLNPYHIDIDLEVLLNQLSRLGVITDHKIQLYKSPKLNGNCILVSGKYNNEHVFWEYVIPEQVYLKLDRLHTIHQDLYKAYKEWLWSLVTIEPKQ